MLKTKNTTLAQIYNLNTLRTSDEAQNCFTVMANIVQKLEGGGLFQKNKQYFLKFRFRINNK